MGVRVGRVSERGTRRSLRTRLRSLNEQNWTAIIATLVLLLILLSFMLVEPSRNPTATLVTKKPTVSQDSMPLVTGDEPLQDMFTRAGCPVCHVIPGIEGARGRVGPPLVLGATGRQRLADPRYQGRAETVREYVIESILTPSVYVVPGYPDHAMPQWYGKKLTAQALDKIAGHLVQLN